jgi:hypothetical protein
MMIGLLLFRTANTNSTPPPANFVLPVNIRIRSTACVACKNGTAIGDTGQQRCNQCVPGRYAPRSGMSACDPCPLGMSTNGSFAGSTACVRCELGTAATQPGQASCIACQLVSTRIISVRTAPFAFVLMLDSFVVMYCVVLCCVVRVLRHCFLLFRWWRLVVDVCSSVAVGLVLVWCWWCWCWLVGCRYV